VRLLCLFARATASLAVCAGGFDFGGASAMTAAATEGDGGNMYVQVLDDDLDGLVAGEAIDFLAVVCDPVSIVVTTNDCHIGYWLILAAVRQGIDRPDCEAACICGVHGVSFCPALTRRAGLV